MEFRNLSDEERLKEWELTKLSGRRLSEGRFNSDA
jgi:hypothetical protein